MFDTQRMFQDHGIIEIIKMIAANRDSGSLQIGSGTMLGSLFFHQGQLVDARLGDLTGFQAVNALASVRDAHFSFDPAVTPPSVSSITPSERVVLKQFFGIETAETRELPELTDVTLVSNPHDEPAIAMSDVRDVQNEAVVDVSDVPDVYDEAAVDMSEVPEIHEQAPVEVAEFPDALNESALITEKSSKPYIIGGVILTVLCVLVAVAAVTMRKQYRAGVSSSQVETTPADESTPGAPVEPSAKPTVTEQEPVASLGAPTTSTSGRPNETVDNQPKATDQTASVATDLTGRWSVINTVQQTSYRPFDNLQIGFDLAINQTGDSFTGRGLKVSENGRPLPSSARTPIEVKGSVKGDRVEATFVESGTQRKTNGRFVWRIDKASSVLRGNFVTTAARTKGTSSAKKS